MSSFLVSSSLPLGTGYSYERIAAVYRITVAVCLDSTGWPRTGKNSEFRVCLLLERFTSADLGLMLLAARRSFETKG